MFLGAAHPVGGWAAPRNIPEVHGGAAHGGVAGVGADVVEAGAVQPEAAENSHVRGWHTTSALLAMAYHITWQQQRMRAHES